MAVHIIADKILGYDIELSGNIKMLNFGQKHLCNIQWHDIYSPAV